MTEAFERLLAQADVLSLDIFDTTLGRRCARPDDVFSIIEERLVASYGEALAGFARHRAQADGLARRQAWERRQAEEVRLSDIYEALMETHPDWPVSGRELMDLELGTEKHLLYPLSQAKKWIAAARMQGKGVIFISDMYLPKGFVEDSLRENGFDDFDALFLSSEEGVLKYSGKLFQRALQSLNIEPEKLLHMGDNTRTDITQPRKLGIRALQVPKAHDQLHRFPDNPLQQLDGDRKRSREESLLLGLSARGCLEEQSQPDPLWYRFGYQVGGPLVHGYIQFLMKRLQGRGIEKVYFLSRDGFILKQAYELLCAGSPDYPAADYLFASRRALNFAGITELDKKSENWLAEGIHLTVGDFLKRVGLSPESFLDPIRESGFSGPQQTVVEGQDYSNLRGLYHRILPDILEAAAGEREVYLDYLRSKGVLGANPFVMVDVGWMTSIQHSFARMLHGVDPGLCIEGYYLGTYPEAIQRSGPQSTHVHYLMEYGQPQQALDTIRHCVCLLEFFFAAPEHTFLRMRRDPEKGFVPELAPFHENSADLRKLQRMHDGILDYIGQMSAAGNGDPIAISPEIVLQLLHRYLANPTAREAGELGEIHYADGYGSYFHHTRMARPSGLWRLGLSKRKWKRDFKASHWPMGYYRRLKPWEKVLLRLLHPSARFSKPHE